MQITRRHALVSGGALAAAAVIRSGVAQAAGLRELRFGVGLKAMGPAVINAVIGEQLGYNREEGFTLRPEALGTNANVQIAVDKGDVDIGIGVPSTGLPLLARGEWKDALNFYEYTYPYKWDVVVKPGSPIHSYKDLAGKRVGVSSFGGTEYPVTKAVLKRIGVNPDSVKWIAVGNGVQAGVALTRGDIDALAYYDTGFGQIEAAKIPLDFLPRPANLPMIGGQFLEAKKAFLDKDRKLAIGFGRSVAKASIFLQTNLVAGASAFLKMYPQTAPRGMSGEQAAKAIAVAINRRAKLYTPPYPGAQMGSINPKEFTTEAQMDGLKIGSLANFYTNDLIPEINHFDHDKIVAEARAYRV